MNTEYSVGNLRIRFESRARRRWLVLLFYAFMAVLDFACVHNCTQPSYPAAWIVSGLAIVAFSLLIVLSWLGAPWRMRDDEREIHRREHVFARAYRALGVFVVALFLSVVPLFPGANPITPLLPPVARKLLIQLPLLLPFATVILYVSLPPAILLWTEPDMEEPQ
jgi:hypothetical protein